MCCGRLVRFWCLLVGWSNCVLLGAKLVYLYGVWRKAGMSDILWKIDVSVVSGSVLMYLFGVE